MNNRINVTFDISLLGQTHSGWGLFGGLYRYADMLFAALAEHDQCRLIPSTGHDDKVWHVRDYLAECYPEMVKYVPEAFYHRWIYQGLLEADNRAKSEAGRRALSARIKRETVRVAYKLSCLKNRAVTIHSMAAPGVYHSPYPPLPGVLPKTPLVPVITIHDIIHILFPHYANEAEAQLMKKRIDSAGERGWYLCVSEASRTDLLELRPEIDPARIFVTPLGVSDEFYPVTDSQMIGDTLARYNVPRESRYFMALSTIHPRKNFPGIITAFEKLVKQEKPDDLYLVIAGSPHRGSGEVKRQIEASGEIADRIVVTGKVPDEELPVLYSGAEAFLFPSFYEGFGIPILEAMKCSTPVITSNVSSMPEVAGDAAIIIDPHDNDALCQAMLDILEDGGLALELSLKGIARARDFTWERCADMTVAGYREAMAGV
jgi:glycosyltransferase involved in cell wall biosynthesis